MRFLAILLLTSSLLWAVGPTAGTGPATANLWIDANGGTCTRSASPASYVDAAACSSMQTALTAASAGDKIVIKNGTYGSQNLSSSGKSSAVNFFAETYGSVLIGGLSISIDKIHVTGVIASGSGETRGSLDVQNSTSTQWTDVVIDGFRAKNFFVSAPGVTIINGEFGSANACNNVGTEDAARFWGWGPSDALTPINDTLKNSLVHDWIAPPDGACGGSVHADGFQADGGTNMLLDGNIFYNNASSNVQQGIFSGPTLTSMTLQNNFFGATECCNNLSMGQAPCSGIVIRNNTIVGGVDNAGGCTGSPTHDGNLFVATVSTCNVGATFVGANNVFQASGGTTCGTSPKRCNPSWLTSAPPAWGGAQPDPRMASSDTCTLGAADVSDFPPMDMFGTSRPQGSAPDAGAFEIGAAAAGTSFTQSNNCPTTLTPSTSCTITVFFQPQTSGTQTANLSVASNAAGSLTPLSGIGLVPATLTLSPSTVNFGNVVVGSTSTGTSITLSNAGGSAAAISSIVASTHFTQSNNCPASLAGGSNCTINVTASPVATGVLNGTLTVTASVTGSPFVANLSVNGVTPVAVLAPSSINFGNQFSGSSSAPQQFSLSNTGTSTLTFTITKVGTNPGDFSVTTQCTGTLAAGSSCPITVVFSPITTGARSATVRITDDAAGSPHDAAVSGIGIATAPAVCLGVTSVNFGNQPVNTSSATRPVVVTNCGTANLVISAVNATGNFSSTGCVATVAPNATCTITGTFSPLSSGSLTGQFSVVSNAASSPDIISLSGFGTQTGATLTSTAAFGHVVVGVTSAIIPLTLTNTGNTSLSLNAPAITGSNPGDFSFGTSCGATLSPNATCQLSATFTPTTTGARSATLTQSFAGGPTSVTSALSGTGDAAVPAVTLTPATLDFGSITTGVTSASKTVQIQNSGTAILNITSITLTGTNAADYALTNHCGATLAIGSVCTVDVTVTPGGTGARTANVHLIDDAANTPQNATMTTNGVASPAPRVALSPTSLAFSPPSIQTGTTSGAQNVTATNTGNANLVVSSVTLAGSNPGDFTISNNCATVAAGATCSATVHCVPTVAGSRTATVSFASNAASSPDTAAISCTGFVGTPTILLAVSNINFGNQTVGTVSGPAAFTLTNTGLATATSVAITSVGDFAVTDNCGGSITAGSSCSATVTFSPLVLCGQTDPNDPNTCISNVHLGTISVASNTSNSPQSVNLQGTAIPVAPPPGPIIMGVGGKISIGGRMVIN